jgi:hypothetical protein
MAPGMSGRRYLRRPNQIEAAQPADTGWAATRVNAVAKLLPRVPVNS